VAAGGRAASAPPPAPPPQEKAEGSVIKLTVTIPATECKKAFDSTMKTIRKQAKIEGFRPGAKIPDTIVYDHMGGKAKVMEYALEDALRRGMKAAMDTVSARALDESDRILSDPAALLESFATDQPLTFECQVDVPPTLEWKTDYKSLSVSVTLENSPEGDAAAVEKALKAYQKARGELKVKVDREGVVEEGNVVVLDFECFENTEERKPIPGLAMQKWRLDTEDTDILPSMIENVLGMKPAEEKEFVLTFPDNWQPKSLAGTKAKCLVKVKEVLNLEVQDLTDDDAKNIAEGCTTLQEARDRLLAIQTQNSTDANQRAVDQVRGP